jgi:hypothetical protein
MPHNGFFWKKNMNYPYLSNIPLVFMASIQKPTLMHVQWLLPNKLIIKVITLALKLIIASFIFLHLKKDINTFCDLFFLFKNLP